MRQNLIHAASLSKPLSSIPRESCYVSSSSRTEINVSGRELPTACGVWECGTYINNTQQPTRGERAKRLPSLCAVMCQGEQYTCKDGVFRITTTGSFGVTRLYLNKQYMALKLGELCYLMNIFHIVQNQLIMYIDALRDVMICYDCIKFKYPS
jgi:hypothetical protein